MNYYTKDKKVYLNLPAKNNGRFRYKNRNNLQEYGTGISVVQQGYSENTYLEWQIGYDIYKKDIDKRSTKLLHLEFEGSQERAKHPYELSEVFYESVFSGIIGIDKVNELIEKIENVQHFFEDDFKINIPKMTQEEYNGIPMLRADIVLPSFIFPQENEMTLEVSIQKQQYATGVQPMVYLSIPVKLFEKQEEGQESCLTYVVDETNYQFLLNSFLVFGMCTKQHNKDVLNILNLIKNDLLEDALCV